MASSHEHQTSEVSCPEVTLFESFEFKPRFLPTLHEFPHNAQTIALEQRRVREDLYRRVTSDTRMKAHEKCEAMLLPARKDRWEGDTKCMSYQYINKLQHKTCSKSHKFSMLTFCKDSQRSTVTTLKHKTCGKSHKFPRLTFFKGSQRNSVLPPVSLRMLTVPYRPP